MAYQINNELETQVERIIKKRLKISTEENVPFSILRNLILHSFYIGSGVSDTTISRHLGTPRQTYIKILRDLLETVPEDCLPDIKQND